MLSRPELNDEVLYSKVKYNSQHKGYEFNLSNMELTDEDIANRIVPFLKRIAGDSVVITSLIIRNNQIGNFGFIQLVNAIGQSNIHFINAYKNPIDELFFRLAIKDFENLPATGGFFFSSSLPYKKLSESEINKIYESNPIQKTNAINEIDGQASSVAAEITQPATVPSLIALSLFKIKSDAQLYAKAMQDKNFPGEMKAALRELNSYSRR